MNTGPAGARNSRTTGPGLRVQLVLALGLFALLAFVPLYLAVASLTRATLRANREEGARMLGRAIAGRLAAEADRRYDADALRDVVVRSLDARRAAGESTTGVEQRSGQAWGEGVVGIRVDPGMADEKDAHSIEVGNGSALAVLRDQSRAEMGPGERTTHAIAEGLGPILVVEAPFVGSGEGRAPSIGRVQVALRTGDQASRAAPLLRLVAFYTAGFAVVLIVFVYLFLTRLIVRPIGTLVEAARRVDAGTSRRIEVRPALGGAAEVAELARAIARTTSRLVEREELLAAKVAQLEATKADLLAARDAIVRSERLASVGRLSAGLAHEVGNPIAALLGLEEVLLTGDLDVETRDLVMRMRRETERVHRVMRDLLDFARAGQQPGDEVNTTSSIRDVVMEVLALVTPQGKMRGIRLDIDIAPDLPSLPIPEGRLQQVLLNLIMNAADAMEEESSPTGNGVSRQIAVRARTCTRDGTSGRADFVRVEVEDSGPGVSEAVQAQLFEPFVTTKEVGKGTGLGLAVCRGLVEAAGGSIVLASGLSGVGDAGRRGACFVIDLPLHPRPRSGPPTA